MGTYTIQNGCNGVIESELRGMVQAKFDLGLLQEINITNMVYAQDSAGFCVIALDAPIRHRRGVDLFYKELLRFAVEATNGTARTL